MTAIGASANESAQSGAAQITSPAEVEVVEAVAVEAPATGLMAGDPMALGLPTFIVGSVALGLTLVGMVPAAAVGAPKTPIRLPERAWASTVRVLGNDS